MCLSNWMLKCWSVLSPPNLTPVHLLCRLMWKTRPGEGEMLEWVWSAAMCSQATHHSWLPHPALRRGLEDGRLCLYMYPGRGRGGGWGRPPDALLIVFFSGCGGCSRKKATHDSWHAKPCHYSAFSPFFFFTQSLHRSTWMTWGHPPLSLVPLVHASNNPLFFLSLL